MFAIYRGRPGIPGHLVALFNEEADAIDFLKCKAAFIGAYFDGHTLTVPTSGVRYWIEAPA